MAKTLEQLTQDALGAQQFQILTLVARCEKQQEEIARLTALLPKDTDPPREGGRG